MRSAALLGSTALFGAGVMATNAMAADGIKLGVGGFFREVYMGVIDDDNQGEAGHDHAIDGFFNDSEIRFIGSTVLDNGLTVGARVELRGETDSDQIDESWIFFSGGFGEFRIGSINDALSEVCVIPPGGTTNFSAFSPNQWGANDISIAGPLGGIGSNPDCTGPNEKEDAETILYISPVFSGFQLSASYTPNGGKKSHIDGVGPHTGMPLNDPGESLHNASVYLTYTYQGSGWGLTAGGGGSFEGQVEGQPGPNRDKQQFYQGAVNLTFGHFMVGGVFEFFNNNALLVDGHDVDAWVAGGGVSYTLDAWTFGAQYAHQLAEEDGGEHDEFKMDRAVATANYDLGPGIKIDGELGYTWTSTDPGEVNDLDGTYHAVEIAIGTAITF